MSERYSYPVIEAIENVISIIGNKGNEFDYAVDVGSWHCSRVSWVVQLP